VLLTRAQRRLLLALWLLTPGCAPLSCEPPPTASPPTTEVREEPGRWPEALSDTLPLATPATTVTLRAEHVEVSNLDLVGTWPAAALARARAEARAEDAAWPRLQATLSTPAVEGMRLPALQPLLARARRAERAATGTGSGAGTFLLRVEREVPISEVERVLYTAAQAGYGTPRIVLERGGREHVLEWPTAPARRAPTREELEAALARPEALADPVASEPRLELTRDALRRDGRPAEASVEAASIERLLAGADGPVTLVVAPGVPFSRVTAVLQHLAESHPVRLRVGT
jgi:hypothetical protein